MLFNSLDFILFFPIVVGLYFALPHRWRWWMLLAASYFFYGSWEPKYLLLIVLSTFVDWAAGVQMARYEDRRHRRPWLMLSLTANLGLLGAFKYSGMFAQSANALFGWLQVPLEVPFLQVLLPVGISFYTFQTLAYSIDVYRGKQEAERHLGIFALYVSFFPQLVAGPIERSQHLLPQFRERKAWEWARVQSGLFIIMWGFFLKLVIADRAGGYALATWAGLREYGGMELWLGMVLGSYQFYGDFAGYSLIAIGTARVMGYSLMNNFDRPFASESVGEFWRRFHISLMTWFRDYLFVPLNGGGRVSKRRGLFNLFIVFLVSGLWHGAGWTFVLWGAFHGLAVVLGNVTRRTRNKLWKRVADFELALRARTGAVAPVRAAGVPGPAALRLPPLVPGVRRAIGILITFHVYALSGLLFFAKDLSETWIGIKAVFTWRAWGGPFSWLSVGDFPTFQLVLLLGAIVFLEGWQYVDARESMYDRLARQPRAVRWAVYYALFFGILFFGVLDAYVFIYFQF